MRVKLGLPLRSVFNKPQVYHPKNIDEKHFRELYDAGLSLQQIGDRLGIQTIGTVRRYVNVFGLPQRDRTLARIDKEKFTKMYLDGYSLRSISKTFKMNQKTTQRIIKELGLPKRTARIEPEVAPKLPVIEFENHDENKKPCKFVCVPTLRELEKKQRAIEMIKNEQEYKNKLRKTDD